MIDFLKGTVGKDYFSDRLYGCQECIAEYLASKEPLSQPTNQSFTNRFIESRIIWIGSTAGIFRTTGMGLHIVHTVACLTRLYLGNVIPADIKDKAH